MKFSRLSLAAVIAFVMTAGTLLADDSFEYKGYSRIGKAWRTDLYGYNGGFGLVNKWSAQKWDGRLGSEGDQQFVENTLVKNWKLESGAWAKAVFLLTFEGNANSDADDYADNSNFRQRNRQYYIEMGGLGFAPDMTFWVGKKYLNRDDIHILDWYFLDFSGTGFGVTNIADIGLDVAFIQTNFNSDNTAVVSGEGKGQDVANSAVIKWENDMARVDVNLIYRKKQSDTADATHGEFISAMFKPERFFFATDGSSKIFAQYAQGGSAENIWWGDRVTHMQDLGKDNNKDAKCFDVCATGMSQVTDSLSFMPAIGFMQYNTPASRGDDGKKQTLRRYFATVRPHFAVTSNLGVDCEVGYYRIDAKNAANGQIANWSGITDGTKKATELKVTPAIVLMMDPGFYTRPQLRLYANYEMIGSDQKGAKNSTYSDNTSLVTWGCQAEAWW